MTDQLVHYILVRRDLPTGAACAQIVHAAGDSMADFIDYTWPAMPGKRTIAVVLGVRDQKSLRYYQRRLIEAEISIIPIIENEGFLGGQLTAIGVVPTFDRERVRKVLKKLQPLQEFTGRYPDEAEEKPLL